MGSCSMKSVSHEGVIEESRVVKMNLKQITPVTATSFMGNDDFKKFVSSSKFRINDSFEVEGIFPSRQDEPFSEKRNKYKGENAEINFASSKIAVTCRKGLKKELNQDNYSIVSNAPYFISGVFDGHGKNGHAISSLARNLLPQMLLTNIQLSNDHMKNIPQAYQQTQDSIIEKCIKNDVDCSYSGSTATLALISDSILYISNIGDSKALLAKRYESKLLGIQLTLDHKPSDPLEKERICRTGGRVYSNDEGDIVRFLSKDESEFGISVTRSFGDTAFVSSGMTCHPFVNKFQLTEADEFLVMCSDGVWEFLSNSEVIRLLEGHSTSDACNMIANLAWSKWIENCNDTADDITVMIIPLKN